MDQLSDALRALGYGELPSDLQRTIAYLLRLVASDETLDAVKAATPMTAGARRAVEQTIAQSSSPTNRPGAAPTRNIPPARGRGRPRIEHDPKYIEALRKCLITLGPGNQLTLAVGSSRDLARACGTGKNAPTSPTIRAHLRRNGFRIFGNPPREPSAQLAAIGIGLLQVGRLERVAQLDELDQRTGQWREVSTTGDAADTISEWATDAITQTCPYHIVFAESALRISTPYTTSRRGRIEERKSPVIIEMPPVIHRWELRHPRIPYELPVSGRLFRLQLFEPAGRHRPLFEHPPT